MTSYSRNPLLVPTPDQYDRQLWAWNDFGKEERVLLTFITSLHSIRKEDSENSRFTGYEPNTVAITQELKIKPRSQEELDLIKEWYDKTQKFNIFRPANPPTAAEWREFEEQLTPGTLRNHIRVKRTLVEIAQDENKGKRQAMFDEMLEWIDELHPLEKQGLTKQAFEIVRPLQTMLFGNEINVPEEFMANSMVEVPGALLIPDDVVETRIRSRLNHLPYRSVHNRQESFWTVQVVNAFGKQGTPKQSGNHKNNLIFMYNTNILWILDGEGLTNSFDTIYPIILLHEISHALWLDEALSNDNPTALPVAGVTYGVMRSIKVHSEDIWSTITTSLQMKTSERCKRWEYLCLAPAHESPIDT
jgi:hypothetical protein